MGYLYPTQGTSYQEQQFNAVVAQLKALRPMRGIGNLTRATPYGTSRKVLLPPMPAQPAANVYFPFKIFPLTDLSRFIGKTLPMIPETDPGGVINALIVDADTATNLEATPPQISIEESWRFWQVRWGYVEVRPNYAPFDVEPTDSWAYFENFSVPVYVNGVGPAANDSSNPQTIPIVLGGLPDGNGNIGAALWIQITPDISPETFPTAEINGYLQTIVGEAPSSPYFYSGGSLSIPIGVISGPIKALNAYNYIFDHARNRYPVGNGNFANGVSSIRNVRGTIHANNLTLGGTSNPEDLADQVFYPGDVIMIDGFGGGGASKNEPLYVAEWQFTGPVPAFLQDRATIAEWDYSGTVTPLSGDPNWTRLWWAIQGGTGANGWTNIGYTPPT